MDEDSTPVLQFQVTAIRHIITSSQEVQANGSNEDEAEIIPPVPASRAAQFGLELHQKFGGGKNLKLAKAIAKQQSLTPKDIDTILDFCDNYVWDDTDAGWMNHENPSVDWIRYLLMGSYPCMRWARQVKNWLNGEGERPESGLPPQPRTVSQQELINGQRVLEWHNPWSS